MEESEIDSEEEGSCPSIENGGAEEEEKELEFQKQAADTENDPNSIS